MIKHTTHSLFLIVIIFINYSCNDSTNANTVSENNANTTVQVDTSKTKNELEEIANLTKDGIDLIKDGVEEKQKADSLRNANEPRIWVYQIGDSYDNDDLIAKAYDKFKDTEPDIYIFKKKHTYYLIKGIGVSSKIELKEPLSDLEKRFSARISYLDLSLLCRKLPTNTKPIKYKIEGEKKEADCKACE